MEEEVEKSERNAADSAKPAQATLLLTAMVVAALTVATLAIALPVLPYLLLAYAGAMAVLAGRSLSRGAHRGVTAGLVLAQLVLAGGAGTAGASMLFAQVQDRSAEATAGYDNAVVQDLIDRFSDLREMEPDSKGPARALLQETLLGLEVAWSVQDRPVGTYRIAGTLPTGRKVCVAFDTAEVPAGTRYGVSMVPVGTELHGYGVYREGSCS